MLDTLRWASLNAEQQRLETWKSLLEEKHGRVLLEKKVANLNAVTEVLERKVDELNAAVGKVVLVFVEMLADYDRKPRIANDVQTDIAAAVAQHAVLNCGASNSPLEITNTMNTLKSVATTKEKNDRPYILKAILDSGVMNRLAEGLMACVAFASADGSGYCQLVLSAT